MWIGCFIIAYLIVQAWKQARAQAGAEYRRARAQFAADYGARLAAGEAAGPASGWWWPGAAIRAWQQMRGPRPGSRRARALPASTPLRRVRDAAAAGARAGAAEGAARAAARRRRRRAARAAGNTRGQRAAEAATGAAGYAAGRAAGGGRQRRERRAAPMAACDDCGLICAVTALEYQPRQVGGHTEFWLLCGTCRAHADSPPAPPADDADPDHAAITPPAVLIAGTGPEPGPEYAMAVLAEEDLERWLLDLNRTGGPVTGQPLVSEDQVFDPALVHAEDRYSGDYYWDLPGQVPPALTPCPWLDAGLADEELADGGGAPVGLHHCRAWHLHQGRALTAGELEPEAAARFAAAIGQPAPELPPGAAPGGHINAGGDMSGDLIPHTGHGEVAEAHSYGSWRRATASDAELAEQLGLCLDAMLGQLNAVNAGRTQVRNVTGWADRVRAEADATAATISEMDRRYLPVIAAVGAAGGPEEICDTSYYREI